jgi:hypothetical protein
MVALSIRYGILRKISGGFHVRMVGLGQQRNEQRELSSETTLITQKDIGL